MKSFNVSVSQIKETIGKVLNLTGKNLDETVKMVLKNVGAPDNFVRDGQPTVEDGYEVSVDTGECSLNGQPAWGVRAVVIRPTYNGKTADVKADATSKATVKQPVKPAAVANSGHGNPSQSRDRLGRWCRS